ncbi:WXG100 family type VII secretion target [Actinomadura harenae]|uniref:WXG100 family type VII secretion target n=1 Tax=Actinomadura harenae TaxID=2483351 RepID=A0A3M2LHF5_9ACTN|nr:hypothetical protein [Actinomadura harenae]RMI36861.1 hypothetical protein EBO15_37435 [Actinomadura harenae]
MSDEFLVKVHKLEVAAEHLDMYSDQAKLIQSQAQGIKIEPEQWGIVGMGFQGFYDNYTKQVDGHLTRLNQTLSSIESGLETTALTYATTDALLQARIKALQNDFPTISQGRPGASNSGGGDNGPEGAEKAFNDNTPFVSQTFKIIEHTDGGDWGLLGSDVGDAGLTAVSAFFDPLGALVSAGVGFLVDWIKPLHDVLAAVTGDDGAISDHRKAWKQISDEVRALSHAMAAQLSSDLSEWTGPASDQAHARIGDVLQGIHDIGTEIGGITGILAVSASVMDSAMSAIKDLISQLVEWLIVTWLAAQAAAPLSFGASEGAAAAATSAEVSTAMSRAGRVVQRLLAEFRRLQEAMGRILTRLSQIKGLGKLSDAKFGKDLMEDGSDAMKAARDGGRMPFGYDPVDPMRGAADKILGGLFQNGQDNTPDNDSRVPAHGELNGLLNDQDDPEKRAQDAINRVLGLEPQEHHDGPLPDWVSRALGNDPQPQETEAQRQADQKAQDFLDHIFDKPKLHEPETDAQRQADQQAQDVLDHIFDKPKLREPETDAQRQERAAFEDFVHRSFGIDP